MSDSQATSRDNSGLYDHAGYWLSRLQAEIHGELERRLATHGVTAAQWGVLIGLHQGASETVRGLASFLSVDGGAVTRLIDRLESKGLVERKVDRADRRSVILTLSEAGRGLIGPLVQAVDEHDAELMKALSGSERRQFLDALSRLLSAHGIEPRGRPFDDHEPVATKTKRAKLPKPDTAAAVAVAVTIEKKKKGKKAKKDKKAKKAKKDKKKKGKKKGKK
jgi:DNA-binding MarR family transcriptional regulator